MRIYCFILLFISFFSYAADRAFEHIVDEAKTGNIAPTDFLDNLRNIRGTSNMADAFLCRYGGDNFEEEQVVKTFSMEITSEIDKVAYLLGGIYYKKGDANVDDIDSLKFAKRLLKANATTPFIGAGDVNYSAIFGGALNDMLQDKEHFRNSFDALADHVAAVASESVTEEELEEIRALLGKEE